MRDAALNSSEPQKRILNGSAGSETGRVLKVRKWCELEPELMRGPVAALTRRLRLVPRRRADMSRMLFYGIRVE